VIAPLALVFITKLLVVFKSAVNVLTDSPVIIIEYPSFGNGDEKVTVDTLGFPKNADPETAPVFVFGEKIEYEAVREFLLQLAVI